MVGQPLANFGGALHHVEHARRHARFGKDFRQLHRTHGGFLGWLEDHGVTAGQGRRGFPAGDLDRVVPGANAGTDAQGLPAGVVKITAQVLLVTFDGGCQAGKELNRIGTGDHIHGFCFLPGLASIAHLCGSQFIITLSQKRNRPKQNPAALDGSHGRPLGKTGAGTFNGGLLHGFIRHFHFVDNLTRGRVHHREGFAGAVGQETAMDEILNNRKRCRHSR